MARELFSLKLAQRKESAIYGKIAKDYVGNEERFLDIQEIIVVEGKDDTTAIKRATGADTIETNGSAISDEVLRRIAHAQKKEASLYSLTLITQAAVFVRL